MGAVVDNRHGRLIYRQKQANNDFYIGHNYITHN